MSDQPPDRVSHTPAPVSPPALPPSESPSSSPPASTASLITALPVQLAALAIVARPFYLSTDSLLASTPSPNAKWIFGASALVMIAVAATTPSLRAVLGFVRGYLPGGGRRE